MSKYTDHATERDAQQRSADILEARSDDWRPAGVAADGYAYPEGQWPGKSVGSGRRSRPEIGIATHAVPVERGAGRLAGRFLVRDDTGREVAPDEIERPEDAVAEREAESR